MAQAMGGKTGRRVALKVRPHREGLLGTRAEKSVLLSRALSMR